LPAERRRRRLPPGYIPGVSPQLTYFAAGTHGKTVSAGLPTLYAYNGSPGESSPAEANAAAASAAVGEAVSSAAEAGVVGSPAVDAAMSDAVAAASVADTMGSNLGYWGQVNTAAEAVSQQNPDLSQGQAFGYGLEAMQGLETPGIGGLIEKGFAGTMGNIASLVAGQMGRAGLSVEDPSLTPGTEDIGGPGEDDLRLLTDPALPDTSEEERLAQEAQERELQEMLARRRSQSPTGLPPATYQPGVDPQFSYFAQEGTGGMTIEENIDVETAAEMPAGVAATTGIMQGAPVEVQDDVEVRLSERQAEEPQNPRERAIYDRAVLALQNELEPEVAQRAIDEFLEVFGPEALHMLQEMVRGERENGGTVETANGETTIAEGELQGPDVIAGKIVDPVTGEETANLRVGENEYIEPAASLARRAQVAGLPPTPENGAMLRGEEERMLRQAVG